MDYDVPCSMHPLSLPFLLMCFIILIWILFLRFVFFSTSKLGLARHLFPMIFEWNLNLKIFFFEIKTEIWTDHLMVKHGGRESERAAENFSSIKLRSCIRFNCNFILVHWNAFIQFIIIPFQFQSWLMIEDWLQSFELFTLSMKILEAESIHFQSKYSEYSLVSIFHCQMFLCNKL